MPSKRNTQLYEDIKELHNKYGGNLIFVDFTGMTVEFVNRLRKEIKSKGAFYKVVKNTIAYKYFKNDVGLEIQFIGMNGIVFSNDTSFFEVLRYLVKLEKDNPVKIKSSIFEGVFYNRDQTIEMSKLPSKKELIGYVLGAVNGGVSSFVYTLNNVIQSFVLVLKGIEEKKSS